MKNNESYLALMNMIEAEKFIEYEKYKTLFKTLEDYNELGIISRDDYKNAIDKWWEVLSKNKWGTIV